MTLLALLTILAAQPDCRRFEDATHVCTPLWTGGCACTSLCREMTPTPSRSGTSAVWFRGASQGGLSQ